MECLFCRIVNQEVPVAVVYEDEAALAFLDIMPRAPGHTLVIPKVHASTILELEEGMVAPFFNAVKAVTALLENKLKPDGFTFGINQGAVSGQEVPHLHVHIMPRFKNDGGGSIQSVVHNTPHESIEAMKSKLR